MSWPTGEQTSSNKRICLNVQNICQYLSTSLSHEQSDNTGRRQMGPSRSVKKFRHSHCRQIKLKFKLESQKRTGAATTIVKHVMAASHSSEWAGWRRPHHGKQPAATTLAILSILLLAAASASNCYAAAREPSQMTFMPTHTAQRMGPIGGMAPPNLVVAPQERCKTGAPLQWRPHLDASGKAYLAPVVAIGSLEHFVLSPIQLTTGGSRSPKVQLTGDMRHGLPSQASLVQHAQSVNNVGVLIEATFQIRKMLRRPIRGAETLRPNRLVSLHYKVSASLATTSDMIALANSMEQSANQTMRQHQAHQTRQHTGSNECPIELTERELSKKGGDLFKVGREYVLFIESTSVTRKLYSASRQQQPQQVVEQMWHAFASHEPVSNQTSRSVNRALCKNCVRPPTVRLVNSTLVSVATGQQHQQQQQQQATSSGQLEPLRRRIKLDCRVSGFPTPWVEWFRNGKLLRNKSDRTRVKTSSWRGKPNWRLSRLELDLVAGSNETGVYECRAMNVAAREPAIGIYTLLVLPAQFVLFPMQPNRAGLTRELDEQRRDQYSATTKTNKTAIEQTPAQQPQQPSFPTTTTTASVDATTTLAPPPSQQPANGGVADWARDQTAPSTPANDGSNQRATGAHRQKQQQQQQQPPLPTPTKSDGPPERSPPVVVGQPCSRASHDGFCLNRGTCVLIGLIEEKFCNCLEGYHGHRCQYKSLGHQQNSH